MELKDPSYLNAPIAELENGAKLALDMRHGLGNDLIMCLLLAKVAEELEIMNALLEDIRSGYKGARS